MTREQKIIRYAAIAFAVILIASIVFGAVSIVGWIGGMGKSAVGDNQTYTPEGEINSLDIEIGAADFKIVESEIIKVESNIKRLNVKVSRGALIIKDETRSNANYDGAVLTVYIPKDFVFKSVDISTGAGKLTVDSISTDSLDLELGAGECIINSLTVTRSSNIEGGAGSVSILDGSIKNLELEMGVGKLNLKAALLGESELNLGVGEVKITLLGGRDSYTVELNKALGNLKLDGESLSASRVVGNGASNVEINGGIGSIDVSFE